MVDEPSAFGPLSLSVVASADRLAVTLPATFRNAPQRLWLRVPWFYAVESATVDGQVLTPQRGHCLIPPGSREVVLRGGMRPGTELSFAKAVADYQAEYRRRYAHFRRTGERGG